MSRLEVILRLQSQATSLRYIMNTDNYKRIRVRVNPRYDIVIGRGTLARVGEEARVVLGESARRVVLVSNQKVFDLYGKQVCRGLAGSGFKVRVFLIGDGERHKSFHTLQRALRFLADTQLERSDLVVALGGGVVGDLAGLASALYLRGIPFIQVPTTLLAQVDASVGGKVAVNLPFGKNLVGAFHQPSLVIIDTETLQTLPPRELTSGWCEAIKQGALAGGKLFNLTRNYLESSEAQKIDHRPDQLAELIAAQCSFKARVVARDEREGLSCTNENSRRILNFGHTIGHALEAVTSFRRFRHGEAVGLGMLAAAEISNRLGLMERSEVNLLSETVPRPISC